MKRLPSPDEFLLGVCSGGLLALVMFLVEYFWHVIAAGCIYGLVMVTSLGVLIMKRQRPAPDEFIPSRPRRCERCNQVGSLTYFGRPGNYPARTRPNGEWLCQSCIEPRITELDEAITKMKEHLGHERSC